MFRIDVVWTGLALGLLTGGVHLAWVWLTATGPASWLIGMIFRLSSVRPRVDVGGFDPNVATFLICLTTLGGFVLGWLFATIWNGLADLGVAAPFRKVRR